jgi:hypothetical protein
MTYGSRQLRRTPWTGAVKLTRGLSVVTLTTLYLCLAFRLFEHTFWTTGLGDWWDPYFINFLLEHWYQSGLRFTDPTTPPMFFPVEGTLGYSHGLILYVPFYVLARLFLHPFQAYNMALFTVMGSGVLCLYAFLRRFVHLTFAESLLVTLFFLTSSNVMGPWIGIWSQRASVFLVPAILYGAFASYSMPLGSRRRIAALGAGFLSTLLYTQDFYTGHFVFSFAALACLAWLVLARRLLVSRSTAFRQVAGRRSVYAALAVVVFAGAWMLIVAVTGGGAIGLFGLSLSSRDWRRPALVVLAALGFLMSRRGFRESWLLPFLTGTFIGGCVFLWIYLDSYRTHREFPLEGITSRLRPFDGDFRGGYESLRSFVLLGVLAIAAWIPRAGVSRAVRFAATGALLVSFIVLAIPFRFGDVSVWTVMRHLLPGFSSISDPTRIIYIYELAAALWIGWFISRLPRGSVFRVSATVLILLLLVIHPNIVALDFLRPRETYARWVEAPIVKDPSCRAFVIKAASAAYGERPNNAWTTYPMDAMWVALRHSIPTLNGYSAWAPPGYSIGNPHDPDYHAAVDRWIAHRSLTGVCVFDVEKRTMTPW